MILSKSGWIASEAPTSAMIQVKAGEQQFEVGETFCECGERLIVKYSRVSWHFFLSVLTFWKTVTAHYLSIGDLQGQLFKVLLDYVTDLILNIPLHESKLSAETSKLTLSTSASCQKVNLCTKSFSQHELDSEISGSMILTHFQELLTLCQESENVFILRDTPAHTLTSQGILY